MKRTMLLTIAALLGSTAYADSVRLYEVTITNITKAQIFTPQLLAAHARRVSLFQLGEPASLALETMAEGGDTSGLELELLEQPYKVSGVQTHPELLPPGQSVTILLEADRNHRYLTMAAMLIPTNDTFVALNGVSLPKRGRKTYLAAAYDAGTEANDQNCLNIPGPRCGGEGHSPGPGDDDEGHVYVSNGFHDLPAAVAGEVLGPAAYDWRNPVAQVVVRRVP